MTLPAGGCPGKLKPRDAAQLTQELGLPCNALLRMLLTCMPTRKLA
jgi:hypothetical protein